MAGPACVTALIHGLYECTDKALIDSLWCCLTEDRTEHD